MAEPHRPRIGLFGGAFDPPHLAHVALARAAIAQFALDALHVLPTGDAWHKSRPLNPAADRLAMTRLAFEGVPGCERVTVDDRELRRDGPTYTIDTLTGLRAEHPGAELLLQIGADQAAALQSWRRIGDILQIATISIAVRGGEERAGAGFDLKSVQDRLPAGRFVLLALPAMPHSSTAIRRQIADGVPPAALVAEGLIAEPVARYIADHHLYRNAPT